MRVIIIEDEAPAAARLRRMLTELDTTIEIAAVLDSVEASVKYLRENEPELLFMDIQLADGLSFSIFQQVKLTRPVIFTTAFDSYVLKAFKVNIRRHDRCILVPFRAGQINDHQVFRSRWEKIQAPSVVSLNAEEARSARPQRRHICIFPFVVR